MAANQVTVATPGPAGATGLVYEGLWVATSVYQVRDLVRYIDRNLYVCNVQHTAASGNNPVLNATYWTLFINGDDAFQWATKVKHTQITDSIGGTGYSALHQAAKAQDWATKVDGEVTSDANASLTPDGFSAKAYAIGGTGVTTTLGQGAAKEWAIGSGLIDTADYSAKEFAQGSVLAAGGSAKNWAQLATTPTTTATDASAKEWATGVSTHKNEGSAKDWAIYTAGDVRGAASGSMSSKEWAVGVLGRGVAGEGSAKDWATRVENSTVDNAGYSALHHSAKSAASATASASSATASAASATASAASETAANASVDAVSAIYDAFHDTYLGAMADNATQGTNPTPTGTWAKNSSTITVSSGTNIKVGQVVTGTGMPTSPKPNVLSVSGTTVVLSDNMVAAGSSVTLTFTGYGIYGDFNGTKDGPALNNDGDALADGMLYFNTTDDVVKVYDETTSTWKQLQPTTTEQGHINTVSGKATEIGLLGVASVITDMGILGTADVVADMNVLGTADVVTDMNVLATADVVTDMNVLATADVVTDMNVLGTADVVSDMNTLGTGGNVTNMNTLAGISANITTVAGVSANVTTVATNIANVNNFAALYQIDDFSPSAPSTDGSGGSLAGGDLAYDSTANQLKVYNGSSFVRIGHTLAEVQTEANNAAVAMSIALG